MRLAEKRQHVMFAQAEKFDVLHHHHFIVVDAEGRAVEDVIHVLVVAAGEKFQRFFETLRRFAQPFAIRIFTDQTDNFAHVTCDLTRINSSGFVQQNFFGWLGHVGFLASIPSIFEAVIGCFNDANGFEFCMGKGF